MTTRISGTREWSAVSVNCLVGCPHDCRYCYARANALRFGRISDPGEWATNISVRKPEVRRLRRKVEGTIMFPTTHDITPAYLEPCTAVLENLLRPGNRVLIVSKPHFECIATLCRRLAPWREQVLLRFTIGALEDGLLAYWEPGAPRAGERLAALQHAHAHGWETSISAEPLLNSWRAVELVDTMTPYVTESIWIGKMNQVRSRVSPGTSAGAIEAIEAGQTDQRVREVHAALEDHPLVRWKDSYRQVIHGRS